MSNLASAKAAIEAEIAHAKQGLAHFYSRIEALEKTIAHLVAVDGGVLDAQPAAATPVAVAPTKAAKSKPAKPAKMAKATTPAKGGKELPSTGGSFWPDLITSQPQSASEVLGAAIAKLGIKPTTEQKQKLAGRATFTLNALVKAGKIKDSGAGRERRFFKG